MKQSGIYLTKLSAIALVIGLISVAGCRKDDIIYIPESVPVSTPEYSDLQGFYLLNEGNMGSNKSTLDYYDFSTGVYTRNIYGNANPDVPKELGDVGNDLAIYGNRLYAVINCSNKVEIMDASNARRIGQVDIPNCRFIRFHEGYAYVTSYAGPVEIKPDYEQLGYVAKIDTATLQIVDKCIVGFQPDGLEIAGNKIYVANSGGYMAPNYENTISVIDIDSFTEETRIPIAINLQYIKGDKHGRLWISSRGDYYDVPARLYCYDTRKSRIEAQFDIPISAMALQGDSLYIVSSAWSYQSMANEASTAIIDTEQLKQVSSSIITDGTQEEIKVPYSIAVNPLSGMIYITDARNYVNPGYLYCYDNNGVFQWKVRTGDIPAHIAFWGTEK
jgi:DNA-binding beta-propeller fold protein YncE